MTKINPYVPIITSNINSLNIPNKRHRVDGLKNKIYLSIIYWKFRSKDKNHHTMKRWKKFSDQMKTGNQQAWLA